MRAIITSGYYRVEKGETYTHLFGRNEDGTKAHLIVRHEPYFFSSDPDTPHKLVNLPEVVKVERDGMSILGEKLYRITTRHPFDVPKVRSKLKDTYEADIPFVLRTKVDAGVRFGVEYPEDKPILTVQDLQPCDVPIQPRIMYIDIENFEGKKSPNPKKAGEEVVSITMLFHPNTYYVITTADTNKRVLKKALKIQGIRGRVYLKKAKDEHELFALYTKIYQRFDPDIVAGWYVIQYDRAYLENRAKSQRFPIPDHKRAGWIDLMAGYDILTKNRLPSRTLEYCAQKTLGYGKLDIKTVFQRVVENLSKKILSDEVKERVEKIKKWIEEVRRGSKLAKMIKELYYEMPEGLVLYNMIDVVLCREINEKKKIIEHFLYLAKTSGRFVDELVSMPREGEYPDKYTFSSSKLADGYFLFILEGRLRLPSNRRRLD